jgi:hypothetical protein
MNRFVTRGGIPHHHPGGGVERSVESGHQQTNMMETGVSPSRSRQLARQAPPRRLERPSLDRPSLFAGMEAGDSIVPEDDEQPRGGILSALESARHRKPLPRIRGEDVRKKSAWSSRLLLGLMATGVVALLGGFIMVVRDGHSEAAARDAALAQAAATHAAVAAAASATATGDVNALPAPAAGLPVASGSTSAPATPPTAAVIESPSGNPLSALGAAPGTASPAPVAPVAVAPVAATGSTHTPATQPVPATAAAPAEARGDSGRSATAKADTSPNSPNSPKAAAANAATTAAASKPAAGDKATRTAKKRQADADVALLEAMFHHTQTKPPAAGPSVPDQIRSACGSLVGAAAATCRARICVNNPSARACHDGE